MLAALYDAAAKAGDDYIYTLLRVTGIEAKEDDPLRMHSRLLSETQLEASSPVSTIYDAYRRLTADTEPLALVLNLTRCASGDEYDLAPFRSLHAGQWPTVTTATVSECAEFVRAEADKRGWSNVSSLVESAYVDRFLKESVEGIAERVSAEDLYKALEACRLFLKNLLARYFSELAKYRDWPRYYKRPQFEVLELLTNEEQGLFGFRRHFSNGSSASFERADGTTKSVNIVPGTPINYMVGLLDDLKDEWRVGQQPLYEIGVHGRYNATGEWKPIVFPGDPKEIVARARELSQDDWIQGTLFYIMTTCHHVIEFAVRATVDLPREYVGYGTKLHLVKLEGDEARERALPTGVLYDGWLELDDITAAGIESALATITVVLNRLAFAYDAEVHWCPKYTTLVQAKSRAAPSEEDLKVLDSHWRTFASGNDVLVLEAAIDSYNRARRARDRAYAFLGYYIALEQIAIAVTDGIASLGIGYSGQVDVSKEARKECVEKLYEQHYEKDPLKFVREAYFECVVSLKRRTEAVVKLVFGDDHPALSALFTKSEGYSLSDIRSELAHGGLTRLSRVDRDLVERRTGEIAQISREFLLRVIFGLKPESEPLKWSGRHLAGASFDDPRTYAFVTTPKALGTKDWRIKAEWIEENW